MSDSPLDHPGRAIDSARRRAALIATAIALPVTVVLAFAFTAGRAEPNARSSGPAVPSGNQPAALPGVTVQAPAAPDARTGAECVKVFARLPVQLGDLSPRKTETDSSFVAAWGDPAIVIRCGVPRPAVFGTADAAQLVDVNGVLWQPDPQANQTVYTAVDRGVYVDVTVPAGADQPLPLLADALDELPALCTATDAAGHSAPKLPICAPH